MAGFCTLFLLSGGLLLRRFYQENTILVPTIGGTYIEGSVGELHPLIPWFTIENDVNKDIVSLVFSGLLKYDPAEKGIRDDLATLQVSDNGHLYTLTLKKNTLWHDSTEKDPHPVTADDVLFTFKTIQDPAFPNSLLHQNFQGVTIEKTNDTTVRFRLTEPYSFFASNLTLGLVPKRAFDGIPVSKLDQALDFGFHPIGAGPYRFFNLSQTDLSTEVTLERFPRELAPNFHLERLVLRIFPDYPSLLSDLQSIHGVRFIPRDEKGNLGIPRRFLAQQYTLPQYVALFFNLHKPFLQDEKLRLGLQLGTNKQEIIDTIGESSIVDTPLLELSSDDWQYQFDPRAAQGALFESKWYLPEKIRLQHLLEQWEANSIGPLRIAPVVLLETGALLTVTGALLDAAIGSSVNEIPIQSHPTASGTWIVQLPTHGGTGSLHIGKNTVRMTSRDGSSIDSFYLFRVTKTREFREAMAEQDILMRFLASRSGELPEASRISVEDLHVERGRVRLRKPTDSREFRTNDRGELLSLTLLTSPSPPQYKTIAELVRTQWERLGVLVRTEVPETHDAFNERLLRREYDVLLFGQSLLDNLDSYPYWHSSGIQKEMLSRKELRLDAYNLSQYASLKADTLLEAVRETSNEKEREEALKELREVLKKDVPAIFLYSPLYTYAHHEDILGIELGVLSLHSDRFLTLYKWYTKQKRVLGPGKGWFSFFRWLPTLFEEEMKGK